MKRLTDFVECTEVTSKYPQYFTFNVEDWFSEERNVAFIEGENIGFAEYKQPGVYWVHFCFHTARGKAAIQLTKNMLEELYKVCQYKTIVGLIEVNNRKARWLIRQVGFKSLGEVTTHNGLCEMFYSPPLTKEN